MLIHGSMIKVIIAIAIMSSSLWAAGVTLKASSSEVIEGGGIDLQIVADGSDIELPEIDDIGGFPVEGKSVSTKLESSYVNGSFSSKNIKTLSFRFFPETDMTIPAFKVKIDGKTYSTKKLPIKIVKASEIKSQSANGYLMSMSSDKKSVYTGESFVVTVNFFEPRSSSVVKVEYTAPKFKNFFSKTLGKEKLLRSARGTIHKLQYLLTAKKDGNFTIIPPKARVGIKDFNGANRDPWGFFSNDIKWKSVRAKSLTMVVQPLPSEADLIGDFKVSSSVDTTKAKANSPVSYTINISGDGNLEDIADPKFDLPGVTVYADDAKTSSSVVDGKLKSKYERKYVFISDQSFTIPSFTFRVFDYKKKQNKKLRTKRFNIKIDANASPKIANTKTISKATTAGKSRTKTEVADKDRDILEDHKYYQNMAIDNKQEYGVLYIAIAYIAGILSMLLFYIIKSKLKGTKIRAITKHNYNDKEALEILYPHINESSKIESMVRKLYTKSRGDKSVNIDKNELTKLITEVKKENR